VALAALFHNFGFFTLLAYTPFPLDLSEHAIGPIFFGCGARLAFTSVFVAPERQRRARPRRRRRRPPTPDRHRRSVWW
jgi:MFS transporter, ACDE family, multidrug resistance protein